MWQDTFNYNTHTWSASPVPCLPPAGTVLKLLSDCHVHTVIYLFVSLSTPFHAYTVLCIHYIFLFTSIRVRLVGMNHPTPARGGRICIYSRVASLSYRTFCFHLFLVLYYMMWQRFQNFTGWKCPCTFEFQQNSNPHVALEAKNTTFTTYWEFWLHDHLRKFRTCIHDIHINAILGNSRSMGISWCFFREND